MIDYIYLFLYKIFTFLVHLLPPSIMNRFLQIISNTVYTLSKKHHQIINTNLQLAFAEKLTQEERDKIGKDTFYNLLQTIIGFIRRDRFSKNEILQDIEFINQNIVTEAIKNNKKIIFITAHYGNWELIPPILTSKFNIKLSIIGRKLDSKLMDKLLRKKREMHNVEMIYRKGAIKNSLKALNEGKALGLLLDQHLGAKQGGIEVMFFGHKVLQSPAASVLARLTDAAIIPVFISTNDFQHYTLTFFDILDVVKTENKDQDIQIMTQLQSNIIEEVIRKKPNEWFWVHKRWKGFYPELYQNL